VWDFYGAELGITNNSIYYDWLRVPAGYNDSAFGDTVTIDDTLDRMILSYAGAIAIGNGTKTTACIGIIEWPGNSDTVPVTDVPSPLDDANMPWIIRVPLMATNSSGGSIHILWNSLGADGTFVVSRAKRKLPSGSGLLLAIENANASQAMTMAIDARFHLLHP